MWNFLADSAGMRTNEVALQRLEIVGGGFEQRLDIGGNRLVVAARRGERSLANDLMLRNPRLMLGMTQESGVPA